MGANDVKTRYSLNPAEIAKGCLMLIRMIKASGCGPGGAPPALVLISPPAMRLVDSLHEDFGPQRAAKSLAVIEAYRKLAEEEGVEFISLVDVPTSEDGLHFDIESSAAIGGLVVRAVAKVLSMEPLEPDAEPGSGAPKRPRIEA